MTPRSAAANHHRHGRVRVSRRGVFSRDRANPMGVGRSVVHRGSYRVASPVGIRVRVLMETEFLVLVIPGLDPGIAPTCGVRFDPRIKSGDDDEGAPRPANGFSDRPLFLMPVGASPGRPRFAAKKAQDTRLHPDRGAA
jgi:hypothetical protein